MPLLCVHLERTGALLADRVEVADRLLPRLKGLLGRARLSPGEGLWLKPCNSIHMLFMRFPIDVAFLDSDGRVVRAIDAIRPWRATRTYLSARSALELPAGTLAEAQIREGDRLRMSPSPKS